MIVKKLVLQDSTGKFDILSSVPESISYQIFELLTIKELLTLTTVSSSLYHNIQSSGIINKKISLLDTHEYGLVHTKNQIKSACELKAIYKKEQNWRDGRAKYILKLDESFDRSVNIKTLILKGKYLLATFSNRIVVLYEIGSNFKVTTKFKHHFNIPIYSGICDRSGVLAMVFFCRECVVVDIESGGRVDFRVVSTTGPIACVSISDSFLAIDICFACIYGNTLCIYQLKNSQVELLYSDSLGHGHAFISDRPDIQVYLKNNIVSTLSNTCKQSQILSFCVIVKYSNYVNHYYLTINPSSASSDSIPPKPAFTFKSLSFHNIGTFGCLSAHPYRSICPLNLNRNSVKIINYEHAEFNNKNQVDFDCTNKFDSDDVGDVVTATCNSDLMAVGFSNSQIGLFWFNSPPI
ncbi:hypothetical protein AYI69_g5988 [Smittium culicis]|nr:hypothetical protein AYI69_g5988 [Smittium culicis]